MTSFIKSSLFILDGKRFFFSRTRINVFTLSIDKIQFVESSLKLSDSKETNADVDKARTEEPISDIKIGLL